jgi:Leucine-rich repeat (LRR) protein
LRLLDANNLHGVVPDDFCLLTYLRKIQFSGNSDIQLPSCLSDLRFLEEIHLQGNGYSGKLPNTYHEMPALQQLNLADNGFTGDISGLFPSNVNGMVVFPSLTNLNLDNNNLSGVIPQSSIRSIPNLQTLTLTGNPDLRGSLNEMCKGSLTYAAADCDTVTCRCCQGGTNCPSLCEVKSFCD